MRIKKLTPRQCRLPYPSITFLSKDKKPARKYGFFILKLFIVFEKSRLILFDYISVPP